MDEFARFNIGEGLTWIIFGLIALFAFIQADNSRKPYLFIASILLLLFGISDLIEIAVAHENVSLLIGMPWWLFFWKAICVAGIITLSIVYIRHRMTE